MGRVLDRLRDKWQRKQLWRMDQEMTPDKRGMVFLADKKGISEKLVDAYIEAHPEQVVIPTRFRTESGEPIITMMFVSRDATYMWHMVTTWIMDPEGGRPTEHMSREAEWKMLEEIRIQLQSDFSVQLTPIPK